MSRKISRDPRIVGAGIVGLASLTVYTITVAPTVAFWDAGEFIAAAYSLGITHPPGAPTFALLGHLFCLLPTPFGAAAEVNFISVLTSTATALLLYGIILEILHLWEEGREKWEGCSPLVQAIAAATGALAYAFSHSAWFNAVEAEVYALSIMVTALCMWLALRYIRGAGDQKRASLLLLIAYVLGVGTGNHMLALLTVPSIAILLLYLDRSIWYLDRPILTLWNFLVAALLLTVVLVVSAGILEALFGIPIILIVLWLLDQPENRRFSFWVTALVLFIVGYSLYYMLFIRSGLNPPVDINNPENWQNFWQVLQRQQYGSESILLAIFDRNADFWSYQLNEQFWRYFRSEFLLPFYLIALFGAVVNLLYDKRTFFANFVLWLIMGLGLVVYLNMPDPQPRTREYIFIGCYFATAIWIGTGMAALGGYIREFLPTLRTSALIIGILGVLLVGIQTFENFDSHDRSGDYLSWDYGYNILQTCQPDAILFTNGDNDTYPLWYLQVVEGIRRDVSVINLSILNLSWYIKELRDREPQVPIVLRDLDIDRAIPAVVPQDTSFNIAGISWNVPGSTWIRVQDQMVAHIINANNWQRPIYFAITVPPGNQAWFTEYMELEGFASQVRPEARRVNLDVAVHNLKQVFQYRGVADPRIYKDDNATTLLHNYRVVFQEAANALFVGGNIKDAYELLELGHEKVDLSGPDWRIYHAIVTQTYGDTARAQEMFEEILDKEFQVPGNMFRAYFALTYSYASTGKFDEAARVAEGLLQIVPGDAELRGWLDTLRRGGMPDGLRRLALDFLPHN